MIYTSIINFQQEEKMHSSHDLFRHNYNLLMAGINRIRFIKKKQVHNRHKMAEHFQHIVQQLSSKKQQPSHQKQHQSIYCEKENTPKLFLNANSDTSPTNRLGRYRGKFKIASIKNNFLLHATQQDSSVSKHSQNFQENDSKRQPNILTLSSGSFRQRPRNVKLKEVMEGKSANYKEMKSHQQSLKQIRRLQTQEGHRVLQEKVLKAAQNKQQARKKIEDHYFQHIERIQLEKSKQKSRKKRDTEKNLQEIFKLQEEQRKQIDLFQSSLALEQHLKSFLKEKLPLKFKVEGPTAFKQSDFV